MQRIRLITFQKEVYRKGEIDINTLRRRVKKGLIPGGFQEPDGSYWVDMDIFKRGERPPMVEVDISHFDEICMKALRA